MKSNRREFLKKPLYEGLVPGVPGSCAGMTQRCDSGTKGKKAFAASAVKRTGKGKTVILCIFCWMIGLCSCSRPAVTAVGIEGELYAKNTVKAVFQAAADVECTFAWYASERPDGNWRLLQGIHTPEIVLLTSYAGQYLKCEITASRQGKIFPAVKIVGKTPVTDRGNPNTDWFRDAGLGLMIHFLKIVYTDGGSAAWNEIVDRFDAELFAVQCRDAGVRYVLWALGQNDGYYNSPNGAYDRIVGVQPGDLCSRRDLPADLISALKPHGIRLMLYLPGNPPISNKAVTEKFRYTYGKDSPTSQYTQTRWESVIREWSLRYGKDLCGWWFDGMYRGGIIETRADMSLEHNISTHTLAAKAGNPQSIVTYNYGVNAIQSNSPYDDYSAGEENHLTQLPEGRWIAPGIQWFHFTYMGKWWGSAGTRYSTDELTAWAERVFEKEGVACFDVHAYADGHIDIPQLEQLKAISEIHEKVRKKQ
ncbi:MAG: alpha-L-fucosidase [Tannerella sp.]|jgi:hypothetical protein|nr:alpha-L-fucosidase [Tannerella sp.]